MVSSLTGHGRTVLVSRIIATIALLIGCASRAGAEIPSDLDTFVNKAMKQYNVPGAAVTIVDGERVFARGYGLRNVEKTDVVDADTIFMLASNSKPFTAALMAIMVDRHKIGWNDRVMDYLPEFALKDEYATRMTTPKDLLAHRTGLPAFAGDNLEALGFERAECLRKFRYMEPACSFREKANYSNPGFVIAGMLAAKLAGDTYENLVKKEILQPLSMNRSGVSSKDYLKDNVADAHCPLPQGGSKVVAWDSSDTFGPAGCITSTAKDMGRWMQMQLNDGKIDDHQIITKESIRVMHTPAMVDEPTFSELPPIDQHSGLSYGLGWGIYHYKGHQIIEKGGARSGMRTVVMLVPDKKIGVCVMANQNLTVLPETIRAFILDKMVAPADTDLQVAISKANDDLQKMFQFTTSTKQASAPTLSLKGYAGEYQNQLYGTVQVFEESSKLKWKAGPNNMTGPLTHVGYDTFMLAWPEGRISIPEEVTFTLGADGKPTQLSTESFGVLKRREQ